MDTTPGPGDLAARVRARISHFADLTERPVMGGLGFFVTDKMAVVVFDDRLCLRVGDDRDLGILDDADVHPFEFAGRPVPGWFCVQAEHLDESGLAVWVERGVAGLGLPM